MKKITLLLFCLSSFIIGQAQQKAVTEIGEEVILYDNGTWKYQNDEDLDDNEIPTNSKSFSKDENATFLLKSSKFNVGFWINPKKWSFEKALNNAEAEYELEFKDGDLYSLVLAEEIEIPVEELKSIALDNARASAPDIKVVKEEYRIVNGTKTLLLQLDGTIQGIEFSYYGYYFSNSNGTLQFITYTSQSLLEEYRDECEKLLNGFVVLN
jgi:hypothetical protein|tara:strand:- start:1675 stop:2307 length:633 start_codon:yes stop_codon:yes gene_type:complete